MVALPVAFVTDLSGFEWLDLAALGGFGLFYLLLAVIRPGIFLRPLWWMVTHTVYHLRIFGRENIPQTGPVLLVCNHVSYVDWMLIWVSCPRRVRFVAWAGWNKNIVLRICLRVTDSIPIDAHAGPRAIVKALRQIAEALDQGEAICVFPEARLTRTGIMLPFHRGFERVMKMTRRPVPIVPICISQIWGSIFSYRHGRLIWKWPERIPYPVAVTFGEPLPPSITAPEVRLKIQELGADTAIREIGRSRPPHRQFVRVAARFRTMFRTCLIDTSTPQPRILSYAKTLVGAICLARWLKPQIGDGQNVGVWLPSSVGSALANIALAFLGKTSVNLNYTSSSDANRSAIQQTGIKIVLTSKRFLSRMPWNIGDEVQLIYLEEAAGAIGKWQRIRTFLYVLLLPGWFLEYAILGLGRHKLSDIVTIMFSSGSTAEPKGVMLSHANIAANVESFAAHVDLNARDRLLGILPFFHAFGYTCTLWAPAMIGGSAVYYPDPRQAKEIGELCKRFHCTGFLATATFLRFYIRRCEPDDFKSLRILICGAEKLPVSLAREFEAKFGVLPLEGYGCTELSPVVAANIPDMDIGGLKQIGNKMGTIGPPIVGIAGKFVNPDTFETLAPAQEGLLLIKGANVMVGYLNRPEETARAVRAGWYVTGDMGFFDEDGFITLTGRISRFAKIAGEMVPLEKVEEDIHKMLGTTERVAAVSAVPCEKRGERLVVLYLPTMTMAVDEVTKKLCEMGVPNLWIPADRDFYRINEMPVLGSGKLDLRKVKELALALACR